MKGQRLTIKNIGTTKITLKYQNLSDFLLRDNVSLKPNQVRHIWCVKGTFSYTPGNLSIISNIDWPPSKVIKKPTQTPTQTPTLTPTQTSTPTPTLTPTQTSTQTSTPTQTPTPTETPTNTPTPTSILEPGYHYLANLYDCASSCSLLSNDLPVKSTTTPLEIGKFYKDPINLSPGSGYTWEIISVGNEMAIVDLDLMTPYDTCSDCCSFLSPTPTPTVTSTPTPTNTPTPISGCTTQISFDTGDVDPSLITISYETCCGDIVTYDNFPANITVSGFSEDCLIVGSVTGTNVTNINYIGVSCDCNVIPTPTPTQTTTTTPTPTPTPTETPTPTPTETYDPYTFNVTADGSSAYIINGQSNPTLSITEGQTYTFNISAIGHPFWINTVNSTGTGNAYNDGVTNNGTDDGTITFVVPYDAPSTLYYNCQYHSSMAGTINVTDVPPTPTPTPTPTETPTPTPTPTQLPINVTLINNTTIASIDDFTDGSGTIALTNVTGSFPVASGQTLSGYHSIITDGNPIVSILGSGSINYVVVVNGVENAIGSISIPSIIGLGVGGAPLDVTDIAVLTITD